MRPELLRGCNGRRGSILSHGHREYAYPVACMRRILTPAYTFPSPKNLYNNLTYIYPHSNIWVTGHSLGGALASLLSVTFGAPAVGIESPGDKLASRRLHLPTPVRPNHISSVTMRAATHPVRLASPRHSR